MKKLLLFSFLFVLQTESQEKIDNYSFMKLYVTNENGEVLLIT